MSFSKYVRYVIGDTPGAVRIDMLPEKFAVDDVDLRALGLKELPDLSKWIVRGNFDCSWNELTDLKGIPNTIGGDCNCSHNQLPNLNNAPQTIGRNFDCSENPLESLDDLPSGIYGKVIVPKQFLPKKESNVLNKIKSWFKFGNER